MSSNPTNDASTGQGGDVKVVVAGASGFIGRGLAGAFQDTAVELVGLTRRPDLVGGGSEDGYRWRRCDLFSRTQTLHALTGARFGVYLVHSTLPSAHLTQGKPADMDLICADNFARAAAHHGLEHIIYVGIAAGGDEDDPQAQTRREVESTLAQYGTPITTLRASMVLGPGSVASRILKDLVERLPVMALPKWTESKIAPVDRRDLVRVLVDLLGRPEAMGRAYDLRGAEVTSFAELLEGSARLLGLRRRFYGMPVSMPWLAARWISAFCDVHPAVVAEFVAQAMGGRLTHKTSLPDPVDWNPRPLEESLGGALGIKPVRNGEEAREVDRRATSLQVVRETELLRRGDDRRVVRSVQRLPLPDDHDATWIAREYARWLPRFMRPFINVERDPEMNLRFYLRPIGRPMLVLEFDDDVSHSDRHLYWIRGGALAREHRWARLEFREVLAGDQVMAAIHDFEPRLPWFVYRMTQAQIHRLVMHRFGRYLEGLCQEDAS